MPPPQIPRVEELEFWSTGEKSGVKTTHHAMDTVTITADMYEKLLQSHKTAQMQAPPEPKKFANAGPLGLFGLFITTLSFSCIELGMGGANNLNGIVGSLFFTGPVTLLFASFSDWLGGNFFAFVVYGAMGVFWLSFGILWIPSLQIVSSTATTGTYADGLNSFGYNSAVGIYLIAWGLGIFVILVCSIKTNLTFIILFTILDAGIFVFAASHLQTANGDPSTGILLQKIGAGCTFVVALLLFYVLCVTMFDEMDVGIHLPLGDLNSIRINVQREPMITLPEVKPEHHHHHMARHDEENQYNSGQISMRIQR